MHMQQEHCTAAEFVCNAIAVPSSSFKRPLLHASKGTCSSCNVNNSNMQQHSTQQDLYVMGASCTDTHIVTVQCNNMNGLCI